jgi:tripartite-type tricarboxylate transporter receptor subunit TctC
MAEGLTSQLSNPVVVDYKAGAQGMIAAEIVAKAPADGYTLLLGTSTYTTLPFLQKTITYSLEREFTPVAMMAKTPFLLFSGPTSQADSVPRLIEYAKANPGKLTAANGDGTTMMAAELFSSEAGIEVLPVNYKGGSQMIADIAGGSVDFGFLGATAVMPLAKVGRLRVLAVAGSARLPIAPEVPTLAELGVPSAMFEPWLGLLAPAGTDPAIIARLESALQAVSQSDAFAGRVRDIGSMVNYADAARMKRNLALEQERIGRIVKRSGITPK